MTEFEKNYYENDEFWKPGVLGKIDQIRIEKTYALLPKEVINLLDVGCGNGIFCNYILEKNPQINITGLDRSNEALKHVLSNKIVGDIINIPFKNNEFDCVTCLQVLEHLPIEAYKNALKELTRVSNKYIIISVPLNERIEKNVTKCPICKTIFNVDIHLRSYSSLDVKMLLSDLNFKCISVITAGSVKKFIGLNYLMKLQSPKRNKLNNNFKAPVCPICGFKNVNFNIEVSGENIKHKSEKKMVRFIKDFILGIWPKRKTKDYWIIALYQKKIE
jgi:2-polyprenyl-3-methyl-5-hydroxy-6-metoxy-1,4-benzoquinol methylase